MSILVIDVGTSSIRASIVHDDATVSNEAALPLLPDSPAPGLVEFDAKAMAAAALQLASKVADEAGVLIAGVAITNQRASVVVWDRITGEPVGPGIGWQDLRTVFTCLELQAQGLRFAPNSSATKFSWLLDNFDPERSRDLCLGTVDSWIAWTISGGSVHAIDPSNAGVTLLTQNGANSWSPKPLDALRISETTLPRIVDTCGVIGIAERIPGKPPIVAMVGDQQASMLGQGCIEPGLAKITFGTGGMFDLCTGTIAPANETRTEQGTFPLIGWRHNGVNTWATEAIMLSAGTCVEWLRDGLEIISDAAESDSVAGACTSTDGVVFVPALLGLGTPEWDFGARGSLFGLTRGTGRSQIVRSVLEGVAHRGADLIEAAEVDTGLSLKTLRVDGGMSANATFIQALANATQRPIELSPVREATTLGAGLLGHVAIGSFTSVSDIGQTWRPREIVEPTAVLDRDRWREAISRSKAWESGLSSLEF